METVQQKQSFICTTNCKHHPNETFLSICMERSCQKRYELCCQQCQAERHINHTSLSLSKFLEAYNNEREKYFNDLDSQIQKLIESYENIDKDFNRALNSITQARDLVKNSVQSFKGEFNSFEDEIQSVEDTLSNIKRNNITFDEIQQFLDQYVEKSSFHCSFKDINKSNKFQVHAKQFLAYFTDQNISPNKIFGDSAKTEGMILNLKSLNGSAEVLKNQARILLASKQDFSFLNKQIGNGSYTDDIEKIPLKELTVSQWNELSNILETASNEVLYSLPQVDFTIEIEKYQLEQKNKKLFLILCLLACFYNLLFFVKNYRSFCQSSSERSSPLIIQKQQETQNPKNQYQAFEDGSLSETLNEYQQKLENLEILQYSGIYQEAYTRKLLESLQFISLRKLKLDLVFQKPQMHNDILKLISENHWLEDINLNLNIPDKNRQKIKDYITAIAPNQILKRLKLNFDCCSNPPYICQDTLKLIEQFFANNKVIQLFIIGQNIVCEYYKEFHKILKECENPNLRIFEIDAKPAHKTLSFLNIPNQQQELQKYKTILDNNPHLTLVKLNNFDVKLQKIYTIKKKALQILTQLQFRMCKYRKEIIQEIFTFLEDALTQGINDNSKIVKPVRPLNLF